MCGFWMFDVSTEVYDCSRLATDRSTDWTFVGLEPQAMRFLRSSARKLKETCRSCRPWTARRSSAGGSCPVGCGREMILVLCLSVLFLGWTKNEKHERKRGFGGHVRKD